MCQHVRHISWSKKTLSLLMRASISAKPGTRTSRSRLFLERKLMSTKTTFKRVAAITAAALTLAGFSAVSAHAATARAGNVAIYVATGDGTLVTAQNTAGNNAAGGIAGVANTVKINWDTTNKNIYRPNSTTDTYTAANAIVTVSGAGSYFTAVTGTNGLLASGTAPTTASIGSGNSGTLTIATPTTGTVVVSYYRETTTSGIYSSTATETVTYTVTAASVVGTVSVANSTALLSTLTGTGTFVAPTVDATILAPKGVTQVGTIRVILNDTQAVPAGIAAKTISVVASGSAMVGAVTGAGGSDTTTVNAITTVGKAASATTDANGVVFVGVYGDNTSGTGTITISQGTTVLSTKTVTFYSTTPASITATQNYYIANASPTGSGVVLGSTADGTGSGAVTIVAKDANGNLVSGLTAGSFTATSSDKTCISNTVTALEETAAGLTAGTGDGLGNYNLTVKSAAGSVSGCKATVTFTYTLADLTSITTAAVPFSTGGAVIYGLSFKGDADSYNPGQQVALTLSATDKAGNPIADGVYSVFAASGTAYAGLSTSASVTSTLFATTTTAQTTFLNGVKTVKFYAPYTSGDFKFSGALGGTDVSAALTTATSVAGSLAITNPSDASAQAAIDAAQEATDAANAAYDAANNAMDSADAATAAAQDASDNASAALAAVTSLSATVAKLVKSVAAIAAALAKVQKKIGA